MKHLSKQEILFKAKTEAEAFAVSGRVVKLIALIVLSPEGFGARWHPPRNKEALCAKGRMLFLSLWEPQAAKPDNATLYARCHEMGDVLLGAKRLGTSKALKSVFSKSFSSQEGNDE